MSRTAALEIVRLTPQRIAALLAMLLAMERVGERSFFAPHPFTREALEALCGAERADLHYVLSAGPEVLGYGLLRGWDEGFDVPSLGIALAASARGRGWGRLLMDFLHAAAAARGASAVRLRVRRDNAPALALYRHLGYRFEPDKGDLLLGLKPLERA